MTLPDIIIHLAAQAGVRYSLEHSRAYIDSNVVGTFNLLEAARTSSPRHVLASTSSVYGSNEEMPFREVDRADHPLTIYAATKKANEQMAHTSAHLWGLPCTVFHFFTAYGPWGRPDMALFKFVRAILRGEPIDIYGHGEMERDFTTSMIWSRRSSGSYHRCRRCPSTLVRLGIPIRFPCSTVPSREHWRRQPRAAPYVHRGDRGEARAEGHPQLHAHANRRREPNLCRAGLPVCSCICDCLI